MIITEKQTDKLIAFRNLDIGNIFKSNDRYYIKIEPIREDDREDKPYIITNYNAVALDSGRAVFFSNDTMMVSKPNAVLLPDGEI